MCKRPQLCATQEQGPLKVRLLVQKDRNKPSWLTELPPKTNPKPRLSPSFGFVCKHFKIATLNFSWKREEERSFWSSAAAEPYLSQTWKSQLLLETITEDHRVFPSTPPFSTCRIKGENSPKDKMKPKTTKKQKKTQNSAVFITAHSPLPAPFPQSL